MPDPQRFVSYRQTVISFMTGMLLVALAMGSLAHAQAPIGYESVDIQFEVINGTTKLPGTVDKLEIQVISGVPGPVANVTPQGSEFTLESLAIKENRQYIVTAWKNGVPYFWQHRGSTLMEKVITLHVFDTTESNNDLVMSGLTMLLKKSGTLLSIEYMITINNNTAPQMTVLGAPSFELQLPEGYSQLKAQYKRGPAPIAIAVTRISSTRLGLAAPLTSGSTTISIKVMVPFTDGMEIPVAGNLPVESWSMLVSPQNLVVESFEVEPVINEGMLGWNRFRGTSLVANRNLTILLKAEGPAEKKENLFAKQENGAQKGTPANNSEEDSEDNDSFPWIPIGLVTILTIVMAVKRRRR